MVHILLIPITFIQGSSICLYYAQNVSVADFISYNVLFLIIRPNYWIQSRQVFFRISMDIVTFWHIRSPTSTSTPSTLRLYKWNQMVLRVTHIMVIQGLLFYVFLVYIIVHSLSPLQKKRFQHKSPPKASMVMTLA